MRKKNKVAMSNLKFFSIAIFACLIIPLTASGQSVTKLYNEGLTHFKAKNYDIANNKFEKALEKDEYFHEAYYYSGRCYFELGQADKAIEQFSKAIKNQEDFYPAWYYRGKVYYTQEKYDKALKNYNKALEHNPELAVAYLSRAKIYDLQNKRSKALENYNKNEELAGGNYNLYYNRAVLLKNMGKYQQALNDALKAIDKKPEASDPFILRSRIFRKERKFKKAEKELDNLLNVNPKSAKAYKERADLFLELGKHQKALADLETLTNKLGKRSSTLEYQKGICYAHTGNENRARRSFTKVISRNRDFADAYAQRAYVYIKMNKPSMAKQDLRKALRKDEKNPTAHYLLGKLQLQDYQYEKALENLNKALKEKHIGEAYALRAECRHKLGKHEKACEDVKLSIVFGYDKRKAQKDLREYCK